LREAGRRRRDYRFESLRVNGEAIFEGTSEIQRLVISRAISGIHIKQRRRLPGLSF